MVQLISKKDLLQLWKGRRQISVRIYKQKGKMITKAIYEEVDDFQEGMACVKKMVNMVLSTRRENSL